MKKKIVFLPYDFDTAIGINNEGALVFSYNLEDIDQTEGGADVFNGQQSVLWKNMRAAFFDEIKAMYQNLRSTGKLSYEKVEQMFEEHQAKWPEAIFNEDAWFKYLAPLVEKGNASYLSMLQGSKAEQRKWWLYNRFRYIDSKYNAGDSLSDVITVRGYAKADITIEPYADVYASIKYGSYLVQERSARNTKTTLECPLDNVNDTEIYIYSASQLADVGDLSGLMVGYADFSKAVKLQGLKIGDASTEYSNGNLTELYLGNNELLRSIDVRNCPMLSQAVDLSGCANIEHIYFDGTAITGLDLPKGGIIKTLHLPETLANLSIIGHPGITDFSLESMENLSTCRLENVGGIDTKAIVNSLPAGCRVRIIGFDWTVANEAELSSLKRVFDTMRGLNESGMNEDIAQLYGRIHIVTITGATLKEFRESYPDVSVFYSNITSKCYYWNYNGTSLLYTANSTNGANVDYSGSTPTRPATAQYNFSFAGWSRTIDGVGDPDAQKHVVEDRNLYAVFTGTIRTYTVKFYVGSTVLQTKSNVPYGSTVHYDGDTPTNTAVANPEDYVFTGWDVSAENIQGNVDCHAVFAYIGYAYKQLLDGNVSGKIEIASVTEVGRYGLSHFPNVPTIILPNVESVDYRGFYWDGNGSATKTISLPKATTIGDQAFYNQKSLETVDLSSAETLGKNAFQGCSKLKSLSLPEVTEIAEGCFQGCSMLESVSMPSVVQIKNSAFSSAAALKSLTLPETLETIGQSAFSNCYALEEVVFPASLTTINQLVFSRCTGLKRVIFKGSSINMKWDNIFASCTALEDIYVPWEYGQKPNAPWGATNATVHYVDEGWQAELFPEQGGI
ncbi:MAG: leucine-rich repeat domain-containing protein [Blautia sp.]|nr:leucine-rich repeat domain-containing protein [Blautia sp.]